MKAPHALAALTLAAAASAGWAQLPAAFQGRWEMQWTGRSGLALSGTMLLGEHGGTWHGHRPRVDDNCAALEVPVEIRSVRDDAVTLRLRYADTLAGCGDGTVRLRLGADGRVTGTRGQAPLELQRTGPAPAPPR